MGYYSDVAIAVQKKDYIKLRQEKYVVLKWQSIKWYNDFEEISLIEKFLKKIPHHDFIRIGEEMDDIEEYQGTHHYLIEVQRDISINSQ